MKKRTSVILIIVILLTFSYGISVGHYKIFPFDLLSDAKFFVTNTKPQKTEPRPQIYEDPSNIINRIRINNETDIVQKRQELINYIWINGDFPSSKMPDLVENGVSDSGFNNLKNLKRIDSITMVMEYDMNSIAYLFLAENSNNKLMVYHQGHAEQSFLEDKDKIQFFLEKGYSVLILSMVGHGLNNEPVLDFPEFGKIRLNTHNHFKFIESSSFHPIKFFVEPLVVSLNYLDKYYNFDSYYMTGISGGGWTTILYSAIDDRISQSYPVAGSFPIYLRATSANFGDYEQTIPELYRIANYEELYVMDSYGDDRKSIQILNKYDSCCFAGELYAQFPYENAIKTKLAQLGKGEFSVYIDDTHTGHQISHWTLNKILEHMENN